MAIQNPLMKGEKKQMNRNGNETIAIYKGIPCIRHEVIHFDKPEKTGVHWPIGFGRDLCFDLDGVEAYSTGGGHYQVRLRAYDWIRISLAELGKTQSIGGETVEIPRPKTRVECRWNNGRWEKYLKSRGWVSA